MQVRSKILLPKILLPLSLGFILLANGCSWILLGAGAGAAGAAYHFGKLTATKDVPLARLYDASLRAVQDLRLTVQEKKSDELVASIKAATADNKEVHINLKKLSEQSTQITIYILPIPDKQRTMAIYDKINQYAP